jgi:NitT/TauT family transport system ATP-binding protein
MPTPIMSTGEPVVVTAEPNREHDADPVLRVTDIAVRYDAMPAGRFACSQISFELARRERLTVLGPTGCGKSTMLKAVAGYLPLSHGVVAVGGRPVHGPGQDRFVMFQEFDQLFPWQTIRKNIEYAIKARNRRTKTQQAAAERRARAEELLDMVGLGGRGDIFPNACSGGMKQRVALARAIAVEPRVLLLDEPFGALDAQTRDRLQLQLLEICRVTGIAIMFVTHDIAEAVLVGDRVMMLNCDGHIADIFASQGLGLPGERDDETHALVAELRERLDTRAATETDLDDAG